MLKAANGAWHASFAPSLGISWRVGRARPRGHRPPRREEKSDNPKSSDTGLRIAVAKAASPTRHAGKTRADRESADTGSASDELREAHGAANVEKMPQETNEQAEAEMACSRTPPRHHRRA